MGGVLAAGCTPSKAPDNPPATPLPNKIIDCLANPGGKVSGEIDLSQPGQHFIVGHRRGGANSPPTDADHTFEALITKTAYSDNSPAPNELTVGDATGQSPVGDGGNLEELRHDGERGLFYNPRQPKVSGVSPAPPPYYRLTVKASDTLSTATLTFACDLNQQPAG